MSLNYAILGFLSYRPLTGYDLKKRFDESVRNFWPATQSQIYRTLKLMAQNGWVRVEVVPQADLPDRKVHHLTDRGQEELLRWIGEPVTDPVHRSAWLIQVFFAHHLSDEAIRGLFEKRRERILKKQEFLRQEIQPVIPRRFHEIGLERARRLWQLTLDNGLMHLECEQRWIEHALKKLGALPPEEAAPDPSP